MDIQTMHRMFKSFLDTIDGDRYPETLAEVEAYVGGDGEFVPMEAADALLECDRTLPMSAEVARFVKAVYTEEIEKGNAAAACNLGSLYYTGRIGEQSYARAVELYTIAANGGDRQAAENLGYCYYYGRDVEKDYEKAFFYFLMGALDGHLISLYKVGDMYLNGYFVPKNEKEAFLIYERCCETMTDEALPRCGADIYMRLGDCYADGIGVEKDNERALILYQRAEQLFYARLKNGDFLIRKNYERCIARQNDIRKALADDLPDFEWTE